MFISATSGHEINEAWIETRPETQTPVKQELAGLVNGFAENTTLHGFASLFRKRETPNPLKWKNCMVLLAILGSMSFLGVNLYLLFSDYFQYPVTTSIVMERRESLELPAVTVCVETEDVSSAVSHFVISTNLVDVKGVFISTFKQAL